MFWKRKHKIDADVLASSLFDEFVEKPLHWDETLGIDTDVTSACGQKVRLYQFTSILMAVLIAERRDSAFSPVREGLERRFLPPTSEEWVALLEEVRHAMKDLSELGQPQGQSRPMAWAVHWLRDVGIEHDNPAVLAMFAIRWPNHFAAALKALKHVKPVILQTPIIEEPANEQPDPAQKLVQLKTKAIRGESGAQNDFGFCYYVGIGVQQDYAEAVTWFRKAAEKGNSEAQSHLGHCYSQGHGVAQDHAEAFKWWHKAALHGHALAQFSIGCCFQNGKGVALNVADAVKWYRKAAEQGLDSAQFNLGVCYDEGSGVPQDFGKAAKWYRQSADQGFAPAQFNLGKMYEKGIGVMQNYAEALGWFRKAASQDFAPAKNALARLLANGRGTENFGRLLAAALARLFYCLFAVFVIAIVQGFHFGFRQRDYLVLALGAFVSFLGAFAYGSVGVARANGREKKPWMFFAICSGWLPYMFLMYLIFYRGIWALIRLFSAFSWSSLFAAFVFIALGLFAIRYLQTITDAVRNIPETKK